MTPEPNQTMGWVKSLGPYSKHAGSDVFQNSDFFLLDIGKKIHSNCSELYNAPSKLQAAPHNPTF